MKVLLFAGARDAVGAAEVAMAIDATTARGLLDALCARYPALVPYATSLRIAVNGEYAAWDAPVRAGDEVAVIPPVAGG